MFGTPIIVTEVYGYCLVASSIGFRGEPRIEVELYILVIFYVLLDFTTFL